MAEKTSDSSTGAWTAVGLLIVASIILAFAFVLTNIWVAIAGAVVGLVGVGVGLKVGIMENVE